MGSSAGVGAGVDLKDSEEVKIHLSSYTCWASRSLTHQLVIGKYHSCVGLQVKEYLDNLGVEYRSEWQDGKVLTKPIVTDLGAIMKKILQPATFLEIIGKESKRTS